MILKYALAWAIIAGAYWLFIYAGTRKPTPRREGKPADPWDNWSTGQVVSEDEE